MKKLRPYQEECISKLSESFKKVNKHLLVLPTGAGKTFTLTSFLKTQNKKVLFIAHTREILNQTKSEFDNLLDEHENLVISPQKATRNLEMLKEQDIEIVVIDECHRGAAKTYIKIIENLVTQNVHLIGLTATPYRSDKQSITEIFGLPVFSISLPNLIEAGYLCDFLGYRIKTNISLKGISTKDGDFISSKLSAVINVKNRNQLILDQYKKLEENNKTIIFCASISHACQLHRLFIENNISSECIHGKLKENKRKNILTEFRNGNINVIFNCQILTEGFDEPSIDTIFMCRPTLSKGLYLQMIGRGVRLYPEKKHCRVYEFTDNDYDVCSIEDILDSPIKKIKLNEGESFTSYHKRIKEIIDEGYDLYEERLNFKIPSFYKKEATPWQIERLNKFGIKFHQPLTEHTANTLLKETYGNI